VLRSKINPGYSSSRYATSSSKPAKGDKDTDKRPTGGSEEVESLDMRKEVDVQLKIFKNLLIVPEGYKSAMKR
jgi:hypothetical protein